MNQILASEHTLPTPWAKSEEERLAAAQEFRADVQSRGGVIVRESRVRNPVFDRGTERTTFKFKVQW